MQSESDKHLERSSPPSSLALMEKQWHDYMASLSASVSKNNASEDGDSEESDVNGSDVGDTSWISSFCGLRGNEFFCQVSEGYIKDGSNLNGLRSQVPYYGNALSLILDDERSHSVMLPEERIKMIKSAAKKLYGLIHARYILTTEGMNAMLEKFNDFGFEKCPRVYCSGQACLPVGESDIPQENTVKIYCPKCQDIYYPRNKYRARVDGAYFGTAFPHMFLMTYEQLKPEKGSQRYVPRIFGFKVQKP